MPQRALAASLTLNHFAFGAGSVALGEAALGSRSGPLLSPGQQGLRRRLHLVERVSRAALVRMGLFGRTAIGGANLFFRGPAAKAQDGEGVIGNRHCSGPRP